MLSLAPRLLPVLADGSRTDALALLHQEAVRRVGGACSLLFESHPGSVALHATSGHGLEFLPSTPWIPTPAESLLLGRRFPGEGGVAITRFTDEAPTLGDRLRTDVGIIIPLEGRSERVGVLAIGLPPGVTPDLDVIESGEVAAGFLLTLELARLRQREELEREIRSLLDGFAERLAATLEFAVALEPLCPAVTRLFGADRMDVWLHDREAHHLYLHASSDEAPLLAEPVRTDDPVSPAASALRSARAGLARDAEVATSLLTAPLRGCRRALGTIVFAGVRIEPGDEINLLMRADELGRQLSSALETLQLLQAVRQAVSRD